LFGLVVLGFATDLFGPWGGLLALAVYTVCPTVITHGRLVTTDMAGAGFLLLTAWMLWRAANRSLFWLIPSGVAFGLALLAKSSGLLDHVANLLPLPRAYRVGLQDATLIGRGSPAYLFGRRYVGGSALFFPALLLIKTPIASLGLWVLGAIAAFRLPKRLDVGLFV